MALAQAQDQEASVNAAAASFAALVERLGYLDSAAIEQVRLAYRYADRAHLGQMRDSGEPYITHPIAVAIQCAQWKLDAQSLMAALLHDAMEDCHIGKPELIEHFGISVANLVDGLTKLDKLQFATREQGQAESFRKMLMAMTQDVRVILIKLADRLHNMQTLGNVSGQRRMRIAHETLDIYAPIAHKLGLNQTYRELQDLAFRNLRPWRYGVLNKALKRARLRRRDLIEKVEREVLQKLNQAGIKLAIEGREKTLYSIYRKMDTKHLSFSQVTDIYGFRLIVSSDIECYTTLGLLHQLYKPVPGKFKDHIAIPKLNGYQSLHTTLVGPSGVYVEFQIRTEHMHRVAESGVAAHWLYKTHTQTNNPAESAQAQWLQSLLEIQRDTRDSGEFWEHVKIDLYPDAVYVFTPLSKIMAMPRGATVIDFAYAIHSDVGNRAVGARINGQAAPLRTELANGDVVEVLTMPEATPNPAWLDFVRTGTARSKIRHYVRTLSKDLTEALGLKLLTHALRAEGIEQLPAEDHSQHAAVWARLLRFTGNSDRAGLLTDLGLGLRIASIVAKRLVIYLAEIGIKPDPVLISKQRFGASEALMQGAILLDGSESAAVQYASCCRPIPGDAIVGYLGQGEGLIVHQHDCPVAQKLLSKDRERFITVEWSDYPVRDFTVAIAVTVNNGTGVLARVTMAMAQAEVDITHFDMGEKAAQDIADLRFLIALRDTDQLDRVLRSLRHTASVINAQRVQYSTLMR